jgi:hypothetical protein
MARLLKKIDAHQQFYTWAPLDADEHMPPAVMTAYLSYRLRMLDAEIEAIIRGMWAGRQTDGQAGGASRDAIWSWHREARHEKRCASLTYLNYLLTARESIRRTLHTLD